MNDENSPQANRWIEPRRIGFHWKERKVVDTPARSVVEPELPSSLGEYISVWCADLLKGLTPAQRESIVAAAAFSYEGGPWPRRLRIQRLAEEAAGLITADSVLGELTAMYGHGVEGMLAAIDDPEFPSSREDLIAQLSRHPGTDELIPKVTTAHRDGVLSDMEFQQICRAALEAPLLPEPIPAPPEFPDLPQDYPESFEEFRRRDPPYGADPG